MDKGIVKQLCGIVKTIFEYIVELITHLFFREQNYFISLVKFEFTGRSIINIGNHDLS